MPEAVSRNGFGTGVASQRPGHGAAGGSSWAEGEWNDGACHDAGCTCIACDHRPFVSPLFRQHWVFRKLQSLSGRWGGKDERGSAVETQFRSVGCQDRRPRDPLLPARLLMEPRNAAPCRKCVAELCAAPRDQKPTMKTSASSVSE